MKITLVRAHNPGPYTGEGNNTYLMGGPDAVLLDAGTGDSRHLDDLKAALDDHGARLASVLVTHGHADHASGAQALAMRWPGVVFRKMPWLEVDGRYAVVWSPLAGGSQVRVGEDTLEVVHTPGHAPDHLAFWHARTRTMFAGDLVTPRGSVFIPASRGGNLADYLDSLHKILAFEPARLLPGHGPAVEDPRALIERYLRHRAQRDAEILAAVRAGHATVESIVNTVYHESVNAPGGAARESVLAHLVKLERDGEVRREPDARRRSGDDVWRPR